MSKSHRINPAAGKRVRFPDGRLLAETTHGTEVKWNAYWQRRYADRDIVILVASGEAAAPAPATPAPEFPAEETPELETSTANTESEG